MRFTIRNKKLYWALVVLVALGFVAAGIAMWHTQKTYVISSTPKPVQPTTPEATAPVDPAIAGGVKDAPTLVLELFNPSDASLNKQLSDTQIQQNIEQVLSTSFALSHCGVLDSNADSDIFRASVAYAVQTHLAKDIPEAITKIQALMQSATTTYVMLYRNTDCKSPKLKTIAEQMVKWETFYLNQYGHHGEAKPPSNQ